MMRTKPAEELQVDSSLIVSLADAAALTRPLTGLPVSIARQVADGALVIDLGLLTPAAGPRRYLRGEASIVLQGDWRFETDSGVVFGSSSSEAFIYGQLMSLIGQTVVRISMAEGIPELVLELSGGLRARSFACIEGSPRWSLCLGDGSWLLCDGSALRHDPARRGDVPVLSELEEVELAHSEDAARRWGERVSTAAGCCKDCSHFVRLDGFAKFRDYGVCSSPRSLLDGRVVSLRSGCAAFAKR